MVLIIILAVLLLLDQRLINKRYYLSIHIDIINIYYINIIISQGVEVSYFSVSKDKADLRR